MLASPVRALDSAEIGVIVEDFARAARSALDAGFDGVELHGAHGYLLQQFLDPLSNRREDDYGGDAQYRLRFVCEVAEAVVDTVGAARAGLRLAPWRSSATRADGEDAETIALALAARRQRIGLGYLHICEADRPGLMPLSMSFRNSLREIYRGALIYAGGFNAEHAAADVRAGWTDLIGFRRAFIANLDLSYRLRLGLPLNESNRATYFGGASEGYTDY